MNSIAPLSTPSQIVTKLVTKQKKDPPEGESFEKYKRLAYMRFLTATRL